MDATPQIPRRTALGMLAGVTAATVAACSGSSSPAAPPASRRRPSTANSPTPTGAPSNPRPTVSPQDARALHRKLDGSVYRPQSHGYDEQRLLFDKRFDGIKPALVVRVASSADVAHCVSFAQERGMPLSIRSGGHSYIGASTGRGVVVDLRNLAGGSVDTEAHTATFGAGTALVDAYSMLAAHGQGLPAGSCPSVGISGLTLGGGIGVITRQRGLTCDSLRRAEVVLADGSTVVCDDKHHSDLLWALKGGGGSFGVVTSLTYDTFATSELAHAFLVWPWSAAARVLAAWQTWATAAPNALWSACHVLATDAGGPPTVSVAAVMDGSTAALEQHIGQLTQEIPTATTTNVVTSESYAATMLLEAGCSQLSVQQCHVADETSGGTLPRDAFVAGSDFFAHPVPMHAIRALAKAVEARQADPRLGAGGASFDVLGGVVDRVASDATAWVHRGALFDAQYTASWGHASSNRPLASNQHSLATIHNTVRPYARGDAYQNYADDSLANPQRAYYGANLAQLIDVRRTYDPNGTFTQPQGVPTS